MSESFRPPPAPSWDDLANECSRLRASNAELVAALKKARPIVASVAELAKNANAWAQGIPLNALDEIDEALRKAEGL